MTPAASISRRLEKCPWFENNHLPRAFRGGCKIAHGLKTMCELSDNDIEYAAHVQADSFSYDRSLEVAS